MVLPIERWSHTAFAVSDMERALAFYRDLLGFEVDREVQLHGAAFESLWGTGARARMVVGSLAGQRLELVEFEASASVPRPVRNGLRPAPGFLSLSLNVTDLDRCLELLEREGSQLLTRLVEMPGFRVLFAVDPDGNAIELFEARPPQAQPARADPGPAPEINDETRTFWEGAGRGELLVEQCSECELYVFPPRGVCRGCHGRDLATVAVRGPGIVHSFTVNHQRWLPGQVTPYTLVLVEFPGYAGVRVFGRLRGCAPEAARIGLPVDVGFEPGPGGSPIPSFVARAGAASNG